MGAQFLVHLQKCCPSQQAIQSNLSVIQTFLVCGTHMESQFLKRSTTDFQKTARTL